MQAVTIMTNKKRPNKFVLFVLIEPQGPIKFDPYPSALMMGCKFVQDVQ